MVHGEDKWIKDLGGEFIGSAGIALVAFLLTLPLIDWIFPSNPEYLGWNCAAASVFVALYLETMILVANAKRKNDSARKRFVMWSLNSYFAGLAGAEIVKILRIGGAIPPRQLDVFLIVALAFALAGFIVIAGIDRRRNSS
jgi:hypothetical protein